LNRRVWEDSNAGRENGGREEAICSDVGGPSMSSKNLVAGSGETSG